MMSRRGAATLLATAAVVFAACSSGSASSAPASAAATAAPPSAPASVAPSAAPSAAAVTINWYHIQNNDPGKSLWQKLADDYTAAHPNVKVNITVLENEAFKTKLTTLLQAGTPPDLFQSWGGGGLREQQTAGLVKDITSDVSSWASEINPGAMGMYQVDGKQYGIPFDLGMVGFWYNKSQFATAGITSAPATWDDLLADIGKLKTAGVTPVALAGKDTWTGAFYWAFLAVRECGKAGMDKAVTTGDWSDPCFVKAGADFKKLIDLKPFQQGFLAAPWDGAGSGAAAMAKGDGAIQLMGQWLPGTVTANSTDKKGMGDNLGWFPFPAVTGSPGDPNDGLGGGNGFAVGKNAPAETIDFLHFLVSKDAANQWGASNSGILPTTVGSEASVTDPTLTAVLAARAKANFVQLYLDQATTPALGGSINDAVATLYAGSGTPESVAAAIATAAKTQ
ncbi:MAG TPA: extracellular solute-binding protein [Candidatus Limnocylindrales bacterium]|jgi:raffinose/stachyose/melibiose transport system substrate-binding protein|nr:extracellular solute-binding protein [Candidatus Limnocylindrales bacterium]